MALFSFPLPSGGEELKAAPFVYILDSENKLFELLEKNHRYVYMYNTCMHMYSTCTCTFFFFRLNRLTWHDEIIPSNEIWIKLGGDKGGSSFKMSFQIINTENPNSVQNTCVFAVFEASDTVFNLHVALDRYADQFDDLQKAQWRLTNSEI